MSRRHHLHLAEPYGGRWRIDRQPDDPGPDPRRHEDEGFLISPPDRGSSPWACLAAPVICLAIIVAGAAILDHLGWLPW